MAIIKSRMRQRRTTQSNYDPSDNMDGEFVMITSGDPSSRDGRAVHVSFEPGQTKRLATYEDMVDDIANATDEVQEQFAEGMQTAIDNATDVINKGNEAIVNANAAIADTEAATSNANAAAEEAKNYVLGDISSKTVTFLEASSRANIASGESTATLLGKIKKFFTDLKPHAFTAPVQNLTSTKTGSALDASMGPTIKDMIGDASKAVFKGVTTDLDELINDTTPSDKVYVHVFPASTVGSPLGSSGYAITHYIGSNNTVQRTYHLTGPEYFRGRSGTTVKSWVSRHPVTNLTTTVAGSPLDATMGKQLQDGIDKFSSSACVSVTSTTWKPSNEGLKLGESCNIFFSGAVAKVITNGLITNTIKGTLYLAAADIYDFIGQTGNPSANEGVLVASRYLGGAWSTWKTFNMSNLDNLKTTNKNSIVEATNEIYDMVGGNIRYKNTTLSYVSSTQLKATIEFDAQVLGATATIRRQASTPISSTTAIDVDIRLVGTKGYVDIYATGTYVSGHVLAVGVMAIIKV